MEKRLNNFSKELLSKKEIYFKECTKLESNFKTTHCIQKNWEKQASTYFEKWIKIPQNKYFKNYQKLFTTRSNNNSNISRSIASENQ